MNISKSGLELIKKFEGLRLESYKVVPTEKYFTIGYGHYGSDVKENEKITKAQAENLLKRDVKRFVDGVNDGLRVDVNQNQFDALVSFAYNVGLGAYKSSTLLELINKKDFDGASKQFARWNKSGGKVLNGLIKRRSEEQKLFDKKVPEKPVVKQTVKKSYITHTIKLGETLSEIAKKYKVPMKEIQSINRIPNADIIYTGRQLKIPKK